MKSIHHVVDIDTHTTTVWAALTTAHGLASWWSTRLRTPKADIGVQQHWTFGGDFNPVMEIITLDECRELVWRCVAGHDPWKDGTFRFQLAELDDGRTRLRFWQGYAVELDDDSYGIYNSTGATTSKASASSAPLASANHSTRPHSAYT